jgi:hypothetical protein
MFFLGAVTGVILAIAFMLVFFLGMGIGNS